MGKILWQLGYPPIVSKHASNNRVEIRGFGSFSFIKDHRNQFRVTVMCRVLKVERSGFCAWLAQPHSARAIEDARLKPLIGAAYLESGGVYGSRNTYRDLREAGEQVGHGRIERLMRIQGMCSARRPRRHRYRTGKPATVAPNRLQRQFAVAELDRAWVADITCLRIREGWLYLTVVLDLYLRQVIHSDQGVQYGSCWDNSVAEIFFRNLK